MDHDDDGVPTAEAWEWENACEEGELREFAALGRED